MRLIKRSLLPAWIILFFSACGHHPAPNNTAAAPITNLPEFKVETPDSGNFYKRFSGTLGNEAVVLNLVRYGNNWSGYYYLPSTGINIRLANWGDTVLNDSEISLQEIGQAPIMLGHGEDAVWSMKLIGDKADGVWHGRDGRDVRNIQLKEDYPAGSVSLYAYLQEDSSALWPGRPNTPSAHVTYGYLLPAKSSYAFLNNELKEQLIPNQPHSQQALRELVAAEMKSYFQDYKKENENLDLPGKDKLEAATFSYTDDHAVYVLYNQDDWLVTELFYSSYTGGAHNYYASSFANIDLAQKRLWKLSDMISDTAALRPMLDDAAISYFGLSSGQSLGQQLLVDDIPATSNVYIGSQGLCFVYVPYEIAPFSAGQVSLFIPYQKLYNLLSPAFRERMKLDTRSGTAHLIRPSIFEVNHHA